jgi:hypothetical protein
MAGFGGSSALCVKVARIPVPPVDIIRFGVDSLGD